MTYDGELSTHSSIILSYGIVTSEVKADNIHAEDGTRLPKNTHDTRGGDTVEARWRKSVHGIRPASDVTSISIVGH